MAPFQDAMEADSTGFEYSHVFPTKSCHLSIVAAGAFVRLLMDLTEPPKIIKHTLWSLGCSKDVTLFDVMND